MSTSESFLEALIALVNRRFSMDIQLGSGNLPVVSRADVKSSDGATDFINALIHLIEHAEVDGKINYYFGNVLDYDTPEECYRY